VIRLLLSDEEEQPSAQSGRSSIARGAEVGGRGSGSVGVPRETSTVLALGERTRQGLALDPVSALSARLADLDAWRELPTAQQPDWPDRAQVRAIEDELAEQPPLVFAGECDQLKERLAAVAEGEAFVLQGGDCAETFSGSTADSVRGRLETLLQMAVVLTYAASVPVVKIGRMAGQFAKPRSDPTETRDGVELPAYRGEAVNGLDFTPEARRPDPARLLRAYHSAAATLNLSRAFTNGGYADLHEVHAWNQDFVAQSPAGRRYEQLAGEIDRALSFMKACGADPEELHGVELYASHEGLLLEYERALTRIDSRTGLPYDVSAHLVWIGERTRDPEGAHVEFFRHIRNPIGVKLGPTTSPHDAVSLIQRLNPDQEPGRLTFITRMGADKVRDALPPLVQQVTELGSPTVWICDPMHGNTFEAPSGHKTRRFDHVLDEVAGFFEVHRALGTHPGGIHVEFTADDVTECVGGGDEIVEDDLDRRYETACDPRLNRGQSLDLAFLVAEMYRGQD
jgi:3-deoxy-7-phosphoheptulonate synthase